MKPVTATVTVLQPREEVFDFLDVLANHERFTDHFLVDWELSGPTAGVGARAHMRVKSPGPNDWLDMTVISGERPRTTTEESIGARGRRRTRGTYRLEEIPDGAYQNQLRARVARGAARGAAPGPDHQVGRGSRERTVASAAGGRAR